jgi:peptidoglycan/LPS O-acetylase OafA/YrhL
MMYRIVNDRSVPIAEGIIDRNAGQRVVHLPIDIPRAGVRSSESAHIPALDGLRGVAILMVMLFHFGSEVDDLGHYSILCRPLRVGWAGVDLFFVLSGFLITGILLETRRDPRYFRNFYMRRTLRVFPLYFLVTGTVAVASGMSSVAAHWLGLAWHSQWWYWTYASNFLVTVHGGWVGPFDHFWSLAVEEHFYLVWPLVVFFLDRRQLFWTCGVLVAIAFVSRCVATHDGHASLAAYVLTPCRMDSLACGAAMAIICRTRSGQRLLVRWGWPMILILVAGLAGVAGMAHGYSSGRLAVQRFGLTLMAMLCAMVVALASPTGAGVANWMVVVLRHRVLRFLGRYSYAMYIFHPLFESVRRSIFSGWHGQQNVIFFVCYVMVSMATAIAPAMLSWHLLEKPILNLKRYFSYSKSRRERIQLGAPADLGFRGATAA